LFLKGIIEAGVKNGLDFNDAKTLAISTMMGAGKMVELNPEKSLDELITAVCSKGGTTIEAIKVYNDNNLTEISQKAVDACVKRAKELEDSL
jgi:pyrroline-5-carboxylate reductase